MNSSRVIASGLGAAVTVTALLLLAPMVRGEPVTGEFSGAVTAVRGLGADIVPGTPFSGSVTFDSDWTDLHPATTLGVYGDAGPPYSIELFVGRDFFTTAAVTCGICNDCEVFEEGQLADSLAFAGREPFVFSTGFNIGISLIDETAVALSNTDLLIQPPNLGSFTSATLDVRFPLTFQGIRYLDGRLLDLQLVPEPRQQAAVAIAAAILWSRLRRR